MRLMTLARAGALIALAATVPGAAVSAQVAVRAENPIAVPRADETIAIAWDELRRLLPDVAPSRVRVTSAAGVETTVQVLPGVDGAPGQLLFQGTFGPREVREFRIDAEPATSAPLQRAYVKHDAYRDDVAWETDRIAYRIYGQGLWNAPEFQPLVSSGIDVWLKRVRTLVIDRWYEKGADAYHLDTGEGADFYTVGPTLGAGGSAIWRDGILHRARNFRNHRIIASGPIRLVFELEYEPWLAGDVTVSELKRITMDAGQHLFRQEITYSISGAEQVDYVIGTVKRPGLVGSTRSAGSWAWLSTWGPVEPHSGGHGSLGTAVLMERTRSPEALETDDHYLLRAVARDGETVTQYVGAGWTASGDFPGVEAWWQHLDAIAERLQNPLRVTLQSAR